MSCGVEVVSSSRPIVMNGLAQPGIPMRPTVAGGRNATWSGRTLDYRNGDCWRFITRFLSKAREAIRF